MSPAFDWTGNAQPHAEETAKAAAPLPKLGTAQGAPLRLVDPFARPVQVARGL
jgi:hypothetical protein